MAAPNQPNPISIQRGDYNWTPLAPLLMSLGRFLSIPLQYYIINKHPLSSSLDTPLPPLHFTLFLAMTVTLATKQTIWLFTYCFERITIPFAISAILVTALYESISALIFSVTPSNPLWHPYFLYIGFIIHLLAALAELACELPRAKFKRDPRNKGKLYTNGLFGIVRHPNLAANLVYGTAYGFAGGGPVYAIFTGGFYWGNLTGNAIPEKERYLGEKYGGLWERYTGVVGWKMIPGIY
ncbi:unnamed protein product [Periconia digitata]|uniref:Steroid 5-alpha reductase C-terminal domain-containing protein n=1 Tax=Periconia digitata TaxID=1303443 RepID=A0A9W4U6W1_9PLEO|nr:unnamed protein product [Periconia digitata]